MNVTYAILSLNPNAQFTCTDEDYNKINWSNENELPPPTEEEVQAEIERLQLEYQNNQYQRDRASEYPSIQDQLDALYHQGYDGWKASIDEVKNKYPKPGEDL
jgi:hypothetical protein